MLRSGYRLRMRMLRALTKVEERIEGAEGLDGAGAALNTTLSKVIPEGPVQDVLSGTPLGHPLHPLLVAMPIGAWTSALVFDALGQDDSARTLVGLGLVTALPAAATGASDWLTTDGAERRVGLVHALANYAAIGTYAASWAARRAGHRRAGVALSVAGAGLLSAAGWLGGHLSYAQGVGVDTTAFQRFPEDWTAVEVTALPAAGELVQGEVDGVHLLVTAVDDGYTVMSDRCTHRGAPLHEGEIVDGCVVCPWHGGTFDLADGAVVGGPASRPQPVLESRVQDGRLEVRRAEHRSLRKNPTGR